MYFLDELQVQVRAVDFIISVRCASLKILQMQQLAAMEIAVFVWRGNANKEGKDCYTHHTPRHVSIYNRNSVLAIQILGPPG